MDTEPRALTQGGHGAQASHRLHGRKRGPKAAKPTCRCSERKEASILHLPTVKPHLREEATEILSALGRISRLVTNSPPLTRARPHPSPRPRARPRPLSQPGCGLGVRSTLDSRLWPVSGEQWTHPPWPSLPYRGDRPACTSGATAKTRGVTIHKPHSTATAWPTETPGSSGSLSQLLNTQSHDFPQRSGPGRGTNRRKSTDTC